MQAIIRPTSEIQAIFPAENRRSPKKKGLSLKNVTKFGVSLQKTPIWASICAPEAPSLLISSGHSPRLREHNFRLGGAQAVSWGGTAQVCTPWRRVFNNYFLIDKINDLCMEHVKQSLKYSNWWAYTQYCFFLGRSLTTYCWLLIRPTHPPQIRKNI